MSNINLDNNSMVLCQEGELYKLTFGEDQGILDSYRYFSQDIGSQTEEKDVIQIIELSNALKTLTLENFELKRSLNLTRSTLQSEFNRRLTITSNQLYSRMNQRLEDVERSQRDRVEVVRRAFKTQLCDALNQMAAIYNEKMSAKLNKDRTSIESEELEKYTKKIADLTMKIRKYEVKIKELERQLLEIQESGVDAQPTMILDSESEMSEKIFEDEIGSPIEPEVDQSVLENEVRQKEYTEQLIKRIETLEKQNAVSQKEINRFEKEVEKLNTDLFSSSGIVDMLRLEKKAAEEKWNKNEEHYARQIMDIELMLSKEKEKIPIVKEEPIIRLPVTVSVNIQKNFKEFPDLSLEVALLKKTIKEVTEKETNLSNEIFTMRSRCNDEGKNYIEQIKTLQAINEKLRTEMFTRHQSQSSFKTLHSASVKYAKSNHPIGILPTQSFEKEIAISRSTNYGGTAPSMKSALPPIQDIESDLLSNFIEMKI